MLASGGDSGATVTPPQMPTQSATATPAPASTPTPTPATTSTSTTTPVNGPDRWTAVADTTPWEILHEREMVTLAIRSVAWGGNRWVAVGEDGKITYCDW